MATIEENEICKSSDIWATGDMVMNIVEFQLSAVVIFNACIAVAGGPGGDRPDSTHPWAVHDENRPQARQVLAEEGAPPSDAVVLFDGTQSSVDHYWRGDGESSTRWVSEDGLFLCTPHSGMTHVTNRCSNFQLHVELMIPSDAKPGEGNSGVYVGGAYELQVLHSFGSVDRPDPYPPWSDSYADGEMGAIYGQRPPIVNPCRDAGRWQAYDIVFHAAHWRDGKLMKPAILTAFLNGVLIHDHVELEGPTWYCRRTTHDPVYEPEKPIVVSLQDHGNPIRFRNIWYREIPVRNPDRASCDSGADEAANAKLRGELADRMLARAHATNRPDARLVWLWESYAYRADAHVKDEIEAFTPECVRHVEGMESPLTGDQRKELRNLHEFLSMGVRNGLFDEDCPLVRAVDAVRKRERMKK